MIRLRYPYTLESMKISFSKILKRQFKIIEVDDIHDVDSQQTLQRGDINEN